MHCRIAAVFAIGLLSFTLTSSVALAATDTSVAGPLQEAVSGIVNGAEAMVASIEGAVVGTIAAIIDRLGTADSHEIVASNTAAAIAAVPQVTYPPVPLATPSSATTAAQTATSPSIPTPPTTTTPLASSQEPTQYTVVSAGQPVVEVAPATTITAAQLEALLTQLSNVIASLPSTNALRGSSQTYEANAVPPLGGGAPNTIAAASNIGQLSGTSITDPTISGGSIADVSLSGGSVSATSLSVSGGTTLTGDLSQGRSVLRSVTGDLGFPRAEMSEFIRDNPNWRLSHAGVAIGDFALDP